MQLCQIDLMRSLTFSVSYAIYLKMFLLVLSVFLIVISSSMVIFAILKDKKLRTVNNLLAVNLLVTDIMQILVHFSFTIYLASIHLLDLEWDGYCN